MRLSLTVVVCPNSAIIVYKWKIWNRTTGLLDQDQNIRDLAATILDRSDEPLSQEESETVEKIMTNDPYHIVRYRLAIALYKRGYKTQEVNKLIAEAKEDPDIGELAKKYNS